MQIHDLNTKTLTNPAYVAFDDGTDTYKAEFNEVVENAANAAVAEADLTNNPVAFTSGDSASPTAWTDVSVITTGSTLATLFNRISTMVKNVRWLYSKLGTTDISSIGDGTVTGAISALNGNAIKDIKIVETIVNLTTTAAINAFNGLSWVNLGGSRIVPNIPSGYTFVGNVYVTCNGSVGILAGFDGANVHTSQSINPYITNATSTTLPAGRTITVRVYSLCIKK